jgi:cell fate (sporulation/competence/biofilm development) regulator YlbF (YheA/YmcA/DUF963 family)
MSQNEQNAVIEKTRDLCRTILEQSAVTSALSKMQAFMNNPQAQADYQALVEKGQALQEKQERSVPLSQDEVADFEAHREKVLASPVSRDFLDAQQALQEIRHSVNKYVSMALDKGQVPTEEDFASASCGHGCHCH